MVSGLVATAARMRSTRRQLPITGFAHKTGVVGDLRVTALLVLAACDMAAELCRAAVLDRTHDLHLVEADVPGIESPLDLLSRARKKPKKSRMEPPPA